MKRSERRLLWQSRIQAFQTSGESNVANWCAKQDVPVKSMYQWLRKSRTQTTQPAQWLPVVIQETAAPETIPITIKLNGISIECPSDFEEAALSKILQVVQNHVH
ncbi:IS66 family insertion sequence element accessory protein TnpA [Solibacillus sp. FSL H8-0538]|uniref:IS66 family insertion sequence element accessory protein TnpA n=1 Tax=Solibacillus sp. FSL H8-0538 TaxID=2921400 RepID=UPI0030F5D570